MPEGGWADLPQPGAASAGKKEAAHNTFAAGDTVDHKTFGRGKVLKVDGDSLVIEIRAHGPDEDLVERLRAHRENQLSCHA